MPTLHDLDVTERELGTVSIDPDGLRRESMRVAADLAYYHARTAEALGTYERAKAARERARAELLLDREFIASVEADLGRKPTVDQLASAVEIDDRFEDALEIEIAAKVEHKRLAGWATAVSKKASMLEALSTIARRERDDDSADDGEEEEEDPT